MNESNVHQANAVWNRISEVSKHFPEYDNLRKHLNAITKELAEKGAFDLVDDNWVLTDSAWHDWLGTEASKKYL